MQLFEKLIYIWSNKTDRLFMETNLKITIDQLKNYLGTGLKMLRPDGRTIFPLLGIEEPNTLIFDENGEWKYGDLSKNRPICYRLSDLDKFIPELGFVPLKRLVSDDPKIDDKIEITYLKKRIEKLSSFQVFAWIDFEEVGSSKEHLISFYPHVNQKMTPFGFMNELFTWHFWPFGEEYFEQGLVIDKLKYGKEVSNA